MGMLQMGGVMSMAVNNAATVVSTNLWCGGDNPACYAPEIFENAALTKLAPLPMAETTVNGKQYFQYPNLFFYVPEKDVPWHRFLEKSPSVPWYHNTLFSSIHIAYMLGFRRIYLVGCDFGFKSEVYAYQTQLSEEEKDWNRRLYKYQAEELIGLKPLFDQGGLEIVEVATRSHLGGTYRRVWMSDAVKEEWNAMFKSERGPKMTMSLPHSSRFAKKTIGDIIESQRTPEFKSKTTEVPVTVI